MILTCPAEQENDIVLSNRPASWKGVNATSPPSYYKIIRMLFVCWYSWFDLMMMRGQSWADISFKEAEGKNVAHKLAS